MGTILNSCKETRKIIREIEQKMDNATLMYEELKDGTKITGALLVSKAESIRSDVENLKGRLEIIDIQLEKDSQVRDYYQKVYNRCKVFLKTLSVI